MESRERISNLTQSKDAWHLLGDLKQTYCAIRCDCLQNGDNVREHPVCMFWLRCGFGWSESTVPVDFCCEGSQQTSFLQLENLFTY